MSLRAYSTGSVEPTLALLSLKYRDHEDRRNGAVSVDLRRRGHLPRDLGRPRGVDQQRRVFVHRAGAGREEEEMEEKGQHLAIERYKQGTEELEPIQGHQG